MYLFIYGDNKYHILHAWDFADALTKFYEHASTTQDLDSELFHRVHKNLSDEDAIAVFNFLCPSYPIHRVYSNLTLAYSEVREE